LVPSGYTEQQGPHLPVDFGTWFAETHLLAASDEAVKQRQSGIEEAEGRASGLRPSEGFLGW
jgi:hypothetical protein